MLHSYRQQTIALDPVTTSLLVCSRWWEFYVGSLVCPHLCSISKNGEDTCAVKGQLCLKFGVLLLP